MKELRGIQIKGSLAHSIGDVYYFTNVKEITIDSNIGNILLEGEKDIIDTVAVMGRKTLEKTLKNNKKLRNCQNGDAKNN